MSEKKQIIIKAEHLKKYFPITGGFFGRKIADVKSVDDITFSVKKGETYSLVGESGAGKTTAAKAAIRLYEPTAGSIYFNLNKNHMEVRSSNPENEKDIQNFRIIFSSNTSIKRANKPIVFDQISEKDPIFVQGEVNTLTKCINAKEILIGSETTSNAKLSDWKYGIHGEVHNLGLTNITHLQGEKLRYLRKHMQIIFQDPSGSLNPRIPVGDIISEPLVVHGENNKKIIRERVQYLMEVVGLRPEFLKRYQHEFSGGQRQRIGIARALVLNPEFVVCDEAVSALDVSIQSQIINLLQDLQSKFQLTYLFIAHDLAVVRHMSDTIGVLYVGKLMEVAPNAKLFASPLHPYTKALLSAVPVPNPEINRNRKTIVGDIPSPINPPSGCRFRTRCPYAIEQCALEVPELVEYEPDHFAACFRIGQI
jgi:oligopeptide/dipeptide ABC transporter ATP-binding protein